MKVFVDGAIVCPHLHQRVQIDVRSGKGRNPLVLRDRPLRRASVLPNGGDRIRHGHDVIGWAARQERRKNQNKINVAANDDFYTQALAA